MEINFIDDGIDAVIVDNFYNEEQLKEIMIELNWLTKKTILKTGEALVPAKNDSTGETLTKKSGVFLENVFSDHNHSALITHSANNLNSQELTKQLLEKNSLYNIMLFCNRRNHLLSYYENSDYYKFHRDNSVFTILSYFYDEPKKFTGGDLLLQSSISNKVATVECRHNRIVIIPGATLHQANTIKSETSDLSGGGRYCLSIFLITV
jgi:ribosomal protein S15P/S13E